MRVVKEGCFRSNRFVCINGQWYFQTRESADPVGPFSSKGEAIKASETFLKFARPNEGEPELQDAG